MSVAASSAATAEVNKHATQTPASVAPEIEDKRNIISAPSVRDLDKDAKSGCLCRETSLATIARKPLKRQATVGRVGIAAIEPVAICGDSGLLTASILPDLAAQIGDQAKQLFVVGLHETNFGWRRKAVQLNAVQSFAAGSSRLRGPRAHRSKPRPVPIATRLTGLRWAIKRSCDQEGLKLNQSEKQRRPT